VVKKEQPLQKGELFEDAHDWGFFTESNVTVAWLGTLLWYRLVARRETAGPSGKWVSTKKTTPAGLTIQQLEQAEGAGAEAQFRRVESRALIQSIRGVTFGMLALRGFNGTARK
jgi:hypothetical protein